ncbi:hypothetical protein OCU04_009889 [Sclerotinia nivalis]|uniref:Uncharacterized protein n=1 Tax=Sclerotinia nivalis TaxID=352851 RepID=A0A9X0ADK9_9HELO|nr:hypothetical protein OCU04_009889 [Sclerotinia nivalis]
MGNCFTRLEAEMVAPPPVPGNWENLGPRKAIIMSSQHTHISTRSGRGGSGDEGHKNGNRFQLGRRETPSGIEGLTFDCAGRPVWRDPRMKTNGSDDTHSQKTEHI